MIVRMLTHHGVTMVMINEDNTRLDTIIPFDIHPGFLYFTSLGLVSGEWSESVM